MYLFLNDSKIGFRAIPSSIDADDKEERTLIEAKDLEKLLRFYRLVPDASLTPRIQNNNLVVRYLSLQNPPSPPYFLERFDGLVERCKTVAAPVIFLNAYWLRYISIQRREINSKEGHDRAIKALEPVTEILPGSKHPTAKRALLPVSLQADVNQWLGRRFWCMRLHTLPDTELRKRCSQQALALFERAAEQGSMDAIRYLGRTYFTSIVDPPVGKYFKEHEAKLRKWLANMIEHPADGDSYVREQAQMCLFAYRATWLSMRYVEHFYHSTTRTSGDIDMRTLVETDRFSHGGKDDTDTDALRELKPMFEQKIRGGFTLSHSMMLGYSLLPTGCDDEEPVPEFILSLLRCGHSTERSRDGLACLRAYGGHRVSLSFRMMTTAKKSKKGDQPQETLNYLRLVCTKPNLHEFKLALSCPGLLQKAFGEYRDFTSYRPSFPPLFYRLQLLDLTGTFSIADMTAVTTQVIIVLVSSLRSYTLIIVLVSPLRSYTATCQNYGIAYVSLVSISKSVFLQAGTHHQAHDHRLAVESILDLFKVILYARCDGRCILSHVEKPPIALTDAFK